MARKQKAPKPPKTPHRSLVTPEGVDLGVDIASAGARLGGFLVDLGLMVVAIVLLTWMAYSLSRGEGRDAGEFASVLWLLGFFVLRNGWFIAFELRPAAATPGKMLMRTRVAMRNGGRLTASAVIARNVMRELELFLPPTLLVNTAFGQSGWLSVAGALWTGIFLLFPLFNRDRLRVGDLVAGTWVVEAPRAKLLPDLTTREVEGFVFSEAQTNAYGVMELQVLEEVLRGNNRETITAVARRIRKKIDWTTTSMGENDADFLRAYYGALRRRLEQQLAFGRRRKDKHDV